MVYTLLHTCICVCVLCNECKDTLVSIKTFLFSTHANPIPINATNYVTVFIIVLYKALRLWDTRTSKKEMKLKGHTDNVRAVLLNDDGTQVWT